MRLDVLNKMSSYEVPSWFCEQENITGHECEQVGESDTAFHLYFGDDVRKWIPKSLCKEIKRPVSADIREGGRMTEFNFLRVSMYYMSYEKMGIFQKFRFWMRIPFVYYRYQKLEREGAR